MNPFSRILGDGKKSSKQMKYEIDWNAQTIEPVPFVSPVRDLCPTKKSSGSQIPEASIVRPKLEKGTIDLSGVETGELLKKQDQPLKRVSFWKKLFLVQIGFKLQFSKSLRERLSTDFFRSKSLQKLNNQDEYEVDLSNLHDCKQTTSIGKIKKQVLVGLKELTKEFHFEEKRRKKFEKKNLTLKNWIKNFSFLQKSIKKFYFEKVD